MLWQADFGISWKIATIPHLRHILHPLKSQWIHDRSTANHTSIHHEVYVLWKQIVNGSWWRYGGRWCVCLLHVVRFYCWMLGPHQRICEGWVCERVCRLALNSIARKSRVKQTKHKNFHWELACNECDVQLVQEVVKKKKTKKEWERESIEQCSLVYTTKVQWKPGPFYATHFHLTVTNDNNKCEWLIK